MQRRLWALVPLNSLSVSMVFGGVLQVLLANQVAAFPDVDRARQAGVLGAVVTVAAVSSVLAQPVMGRIADRTRSRLGRRNVWILLGAVGAAVVLTVTAFAPDPWVLGACWTLAVWPCNAFLGATIATIAERVPVPVRARLSAFNGVATLVGFALGALVASTAVAGHLPVLVPYLVLGVQLAAVGIVFALLTVDVEPRERAAGAAPRRLGGFRTNPDFWWTFSGRFLAFLGYGLATALQLFALRDHFHAGDGSTAAANVALGQVVAVSSVLLLASSALGGFLADRFGRMKPFVIGSSLLFVPACLVLVLVPTVPGALVGFAIVGIGTGSFVSVDGALITRVLPSLDDTGKDIGVLNIANAGPQVLAPALAGGLVAAGGYVPVYLLALAFSALASLAVAFIRGVR